MDQQRSHFQTESFGLFKHSLNLDQLCIYLYGCSVTKKNSTVCQPRIRAYSLCFSTETVLIISVHVSNTGQLFWFPFRIIHRCVYNATHL